MSRSAAPLWLMGLSNAVFGMYGGIIVISVPQLLSARQVPEGTIAAMTAAMISPSFWTFLASPVLDVRFSRRWYSILTAVLAAALLVLALLNLDHLAWVEALLVAGFFCANLYQSALGGWLSSIITTEEENRLSVWVTIGNIGAGGAMAAITGELVRNFSPTMTALLLGALILLPTAVFPWMQAPGPDRRLARESFPQFFSAVLSLLKRPPVLIALLLFIAPAATFSLTNFLSGLGDDFHASGHFVGLVGGTGVLLGGIGGCLIFRLIDRLLPLRFLYLCVGVAGALFTLGLILLPHSPTTFAVALIGENVFQALAITINGCNRLRHDWTQQSPRRHHLRAVDIRGQCAHHLHAVRGWLGVRPEWSRGELCRGRGSQSARVPAIGGATYGLYARKIGRNRVPRSSLENCPMRDACAMQPSVPIMRTTGTSGP